MDIIIYFFVFVIGALFGSFFSLAIYRIPIKQSIIYGRSYCPKCEHQLGFLDLIPVFSYLFLGGRCRYCREKISIRYILLEIFSGVIFLLFTLSLKFNIYAIKTEKIVHLIFGYLFISTLFLLIGIMIEKKYIQKSVLFFGISITSIYIIYLYIVGLNIYKYVVYLILMILLLLINSIFNKERKKNENKK